MTDMLTDIFYWILNMSISATVVGCAVWLLGIFKKIPGRAVNILWSLPFLRMWIPIGIGSRISIMTLISNISARSVKVYDGAVDVSMMNCVTAADSYFPITYKESVTENIFHIASVIWITVAAILLLAVFSLYIITMYELRSSRHIYGKLYRSDKVSSPAVYGIFHEKIIIPDAGVCCAEDMKYILMHERAHIKRKDNLRRMAAIVSACIHWYNPMSWVFLKRFIESAEIACDEAVLRSCDEDDKRKYATVLLNCVEVKSVSASALGGSKLRLRIERILSYKKLSAFSAAVLVLMMIFVGYVLLTNSI